MRQINPTINSYHRKVILTLIIIFMMSTSPVSSAGLSKDVLDSAENAREQQIHYYDFQEDQFIIFYDAETILTNNTALSLYGSLSLMTPNVVALPVTDIQTIGEVLKSSEYYAAIYVFQSDSQFLKISRGNGIYSWNDFSDILSSSPNTHHIMAMGNSFQLLNIVSNDINVYGSGDEKVDAHHIFLYALWTLSEILEADQATRRQNLGNDIKMASMQYFADNFNAIAAASIEPSSPLGEESPETSQARIDRYYEENPAKVSRIPREGMIVDEATGRDIDPATGEIVTDGYVMDIIPETSSVVSDFILQALPLDSGQRGPIGGILDSILELLFKEIGGLIGLDTSTVNSIVDVLFSIPDLIGAIANPSAGGIKAFINKLKPMLPIPESLYKYVDLLIDGLFVLRGTGDDIKNFISGAIGMLIPDMDVGGFNLPDLIGEIFTLTTDVIAKAQSGGNVFDIILSVLNENIIANLTATVIGNGTVLGLSGSEIPSAIAKLLTTGKTMINLVSTGNIKDLITKYGPDLIKELAPTIGLTDNQTEAVMNAFGMVMYAADFLESNKQDNLQGLLENMLNNIIKPSAMFNLDGINPDEITFAKVKKAAGQIIDAVGRVVESDTPDIPTMVTNITNIMNTLGVDAKIVEAVTNIGTILVALMKPDVSLTGVSNLATMVGTLLEGLGVNSSSTIEIIKKVLDGIMGVVAFIKNPPSLSKIMGTAFGTLTSGGDTKEMIIKLMKELINLVKPNTFTTVGLNLDQIEAARAINPDAITKDSIINTLGEGVSLIMSLLGGFDGNSIQSLMMTLLQGGAYLVSQFTGIDVTAYIEVFKGLFGQFLGLTDTVPTASDIVSLIRPLVPTSVNTETLNTIISVLFDVLDVFQNGFQSIFAKLSEYLLGKVTELLGSLDSQIGGILGNNKWDVIDMDIPIGIGSFSLFTIKIKISLAPQLEFNVEALTNMIFDLVFKGTSIFKTGNGVDAFDIFQQALSFFSISPVLEASFELTDFGGSGFMDFMLQSLGVELEISGYGYFKLLLFTFNNGGFSLDDFLKVIEWGFGFSITISRMFTLLDFITGGAGGSLNSIGKYIGLDAISITIYFTLAFDIVKRAATATKPETGSMTISITIGFTVSLGIDIFIAELRLTGTLEVTLTLLQDLVAPVPLRVFIAIQLIITVTIGFLFWDWDFNYKWSPDGFDPPKGYELTAGGQEDALKNGALGGDRDGDGLGDEYEKNTPGLDWTKADTDGDGIDDKMETQVYKTDAANRDTDGDKLDDNVEIAMKTNPLQKDSDFDNLDDYQEAVILGTDPLTQDTDHDGLSDYFEVMHSWNITGITPSITEIIIGGVIYSDRTDPLDPDTDGDGLLDGEEGERGIYYGPNLYNTTEQPDYTPDPPLFFNGGYTHPLDNDTDDDSYWQLYDGSKAPMDADRLFLMDMSDYMEIKGRSIIFIDTDTGEPEPARIVMTNPTNPDSDGDTGVTAEDRINPPFGFFLNSDGYELSRDPPTDPLDGDTDDDGLIDGLEGMLRPDSNHTWGLNPDTDGDGLGDLQEVQLGTDGRSVDTDRDGVSDGDEFFIYGTNPFLEDTDGDLILDGEELFLFHTSPFLRDSDVDGISDYDEIWIYNSNPMDEDGDNDFLTDFEEIFIYGTDPFDADTDDDLLLDGEEVQGFNMTFLINGTYQEVPIATDPNNWDSDLDSLTTIDQYGNMSQPMSDYDEFLLGTNPTLRDTDMDGIQDGWELWLGSGKIPDFDPIYIDPLNPDSDNDTLSDGTELQIVNTTMLLNPYISFTINQPFKTRPDMNDTDGDFLEDAFEIEVLFSDPSSIDSDNDTLSDYAEYVIHKTALNLNDTDGDGLYDAEEVYGVNGTAYGYTVGTVFFTHPNNSDSDGDLLPDGAEVKYYQTDPTNPDENANDILDGMEIDEDNDGLYAGEEFYVYNTAGTPFVDKAGGDSNPDSDADGLFDGLEVYEIGTMPNNWDTDNDTYSDGLEVYCGTNPLDNSTSVAEINACFSGLVRLAVLSPVMKTYKTNAIPVIVYDSTLSMTGMSYRYHVKDDDTWSAVNAMYETTDSGYWKGTYLALPVVNATYELEVTASNATLSVTRTVTFTVDMFGGDIRIINPGDGVVYSFNEFQKPGLPIEVQTNLDYNQVKFRIFFADNGTIFQDNTTLSYETGRVSYYLPNIEFPKEDGTIMYAIEFFAYKTSGEVVAVSRVFGIKTPTLLQNALIGGGIVLGGGGAAVIVKKNPLKRFKNPFKKEY